MYMFDDMAYRYGLHADLFVISYTSIVNQLKSFASIDFSSCNLPKVVSHLLSTTAPTLTYDHQIHHHHHDYSCM